MDTINAYIALIKENISYDINMQTLPFYEAESFNQLFSLICDVVTIPHEKIKINKTYVPYPIVQSRFLQLNDFHLKYVIDCMANTTSSITDIRSYLITALYNSPNTIDYHYEQKVQHDMAQDN